MSFRHWIVSILILSGGTHAFADDSIQILGDWRYDGFFYQSHRYPNPNPKLNVTFTFNSDHTARLFWKRDDETGFCERKGTWDVKDSVLFQTVTWINPDNDSSCSNDPDMQPGQTQNKIAIQKSELDLYMSLNGADFIYILVRPGSRPETPQIMSH